MDDLKIVGQFDPQAALQGVNKFNAGLESTEKKAISSAGKVADAYDAQSRKIASITDRNGNAINRNLDQFQRKLEAITKSPSDRLAGDKDILLKRVAGDPAAIQRVTDLWTAFREEQDKIAKTQALTQFGTNVKQFVQNPLAGATSAIGSFASEIGSAGLIAGGVAAGIGAVARAGYDAAKSLGEYGVGIRDVQVRTGLTAQQVGQFSFAAKAAGSDVSVFDRTMKGLTQALTDNSSESDKARDALQKLGVAPRDLAGNLRPTADLLLDISEGFNKIPNAIERDKVALDLFKKSGIEAAPVILDLAKNVRLAQDIGLGPSQSDVDKFVGYNRTIAEADALWEQLKRSVKEPLAATIVFALRGPDNKALSTSDLQKMGVSLGRFAPPNPDDTRNAAINAGFGGQIRRDEGFTTAKLYEDAENAPYYASNRDKLKTFLDSDSSLGGAEEKLAKLKQSYDAARSSSYQLVQGAGLLPQVAADAETKVKATGNAYRQQLDTVKALEREEEKRRAAPEELARIKQQTATLEDESRFKSFGDEGGIQTKIFQTEREFELKIKEFPTLLEALSHQRQLALDALHQQLVDVRQKNSEDRAILTAQFNDLAPNTNPYEKYLSLAFKENIKDAEDERNLRSSTIQAESDKTIRLLELRGSGPGGEIDLANKVAAIRQTALEQEFQLSGDINKYREESLKNQIDLQLKMAEESKREFDNIKSTVANLTQTLFDKPSQFGSQLASVLKRSITEPISQGVGGFFAKHLQPLIYGPDGQHGIAGRLNHISKLEQANHLGDVDLVNGAVPVLVTNPGASSSSGLSGAAAAPFGGLSGGGLGGLFSGLGGLFGLSGGGSSAPPGAVSSTIDFGDGPISTGAGSIFGSGSILGGPGGTTGFAGDVGDLAGSGGGSGGGSGAGGLLGLFKNLGGGGSGSAASFAPLGLLGSALGLGGAFKLGQSSNPLSKALAPVLGGVSGLVGFGSLASLFPALVAAGPVGWIAAAGIGITVGLLGNFFKTASQKTHDKIKSVYGVDVTDQGVLSQITQTIKTSYGGDIDLGIQSQQVRELISLYAMTTGQSSKGIVQTVTPSAFSNTGGQLTQLPTYVNGQPTYPTYGSAQTGGGSLTPAVTPMTLQLDGPATTALLQGQAAQVIASSPRLISSQAAAGQTSSAGRRQAAANLLSPSFLTS